MANKQFNSVDGYSVGNASIVIDSNGNVSGNLITATANVTAPRFISNVSTGTAPFVVTSTTQVANLSVATAASATSATTAGTVTTAAQPNITSVGTLTSLNSSGTITAPAFTANTGVFTGNGAALTNLNASNVSSGTLAQARLANSTLTLGNTTLTLGATTTTVAGLSSVTSTTFVGSLTGAATTAGTVTTAAQPNITSVGTLTSLNVSGNANAGNIGATNFVGSGASLTNLNASNLASGTVPSARLSGTYTITVSGSATTAGTVTTAAQPNITSVGTLTGLAVSGTAGITSTDSSGAASTTKIINAINGTRDLSLIPRAGAGSYNNLVGADDAAIVFANSSAQGNANLTIAPWATATSGIRIQSVSNTATVFLNATNTNVSAALNVSGTITGNGSGLSALNGSNVTTGTIAAARVATLNQNTTGSAATVTTAAQPNITSVGTLTSLTMSGLITGSSSASTDVNTANDTGSFSARGNSTTVASMSFHRTGAYAINMGLGTDNIFRIGGWSASNNAFQLTGAGALTILSTMNAPTVQTTTLTTGANSTAGTVTGNWTLSAGSRWQSTYADLAERYVADNTYEPGTVVVLGGEKEVTIENIADSHKVAGVITTNPAYIMNAELEGDNVVEVALIGRVPCKVVGPISKGDLLTSAEIAGYAHANNIATAGRIIGKSLENFDGEKGVIEIMVGKT